MSVLKHVQPGQRNQVRKDVDAFVTRFYEGEIRHAELVSPDYVRLWRVLLETYVAGGKRLRPYMLILSHGACAGDPEQDTMPVAAALELLHCSLLIHDDIIDRDTVRHGKLNVGGQYREIYGDAHGEARRDHLADSAAILGGDLLLAAAHRFIAESKLEADKKLEALKLLGDAVFNVAGGELLDAESVIMRMQDVDSLAIAKYKTAHYSFVTPLVMGATLAGASPAIRAGLTDYGVALGIAFQLADDLLGLFGDEEETGKPATSDLREGRRTYLLQRAYQMATDAEIAELDAIVGDETVSHEQLERARTIVRECGAYDATVGEIQEYTAQAEAALSNLAFAPEFHDEFMTLINRATVRRA
jgi:geranylgeranyl diphosphate synthase, type II